MQREWISTFFTSNEWNLVGIGPDWLCYLVVESKMAAICLIDFYFDVYPTVLHKFYYIKYKNQFHVQQVLQFEDIFHSSSTSSLPTELYE